MTSGGFSFQPQKRRTQAPPAEPASQATRLWDWGWGGRGWAGPAHVLQGPVREENVGALFQVMRTFRMVTTEH